jgi:hypothetical protein
MQTKTSLQAAEQMTALETASAISIMPLHDVLDKLILGDYGVTAGLAFLQWLTSDQDYYVRKLVSMDNLDEAKNLIINEKSLNYSNADCDWRTWLRSFCLEGVPARVWWSYQQNVASQLRASVAKVN